MAFLVSEARPEDVPELTSVYFASFIDSFSMSMFPRTPEVRTWWEGDLGQAFTDPHARMIKVVDDESGEIAAFAKWVLPATDSEHKEDEPLPEWPEGSDKELCQNFFSGLLETKKRLMGSRAYYCKCRLSATTRYSVSDDNGFVDLEMLATHPKYQKKGAASMLIRWGTELADAADMPAYLDGSPVGVALYRRYGWVEKDVVVPEVNEPGSQERWEKRYLCMIREPKAAVV
jgi:GNAT superfamily N-acetyltransferase